MPARYSCGWRICSKHQTHNDNIAVAKPVRRKDLVQPRLLCAAASRVGRARKRANHQRVGRGATVPPRAGDVTQRPPNARRCPGALPERRHTSSRFGGVAWPPLAIAGARVAGLSPTDHARQREAVEGRRPPSACTRSNACPKKTDAHGSRGENREAAESRRKRRSEELLTTSRRVSTDGDLPPRPGAPKRAYALRHVP